MKNVKSIFYQTLVSAPETGCAYLFNELDAPLHRHEDFYELTLVTYGSFLNEYNGVQTVLDQNTIIFYKIGEKHALYSNEENSIHFSFAISQETFDKYSDMFGPELENQSVMIRQLTDVQGDYLTMLARKMRNNLQMDKLGKYVELFITNAFFLLSAEEQKLSQEMDQYIEDLVSCLNHFRLLDCSVKEIYSRYPVAPSALITNFKKRTGHTIVEYVRMKRLDYGAQLLSLRDCSISEITKMLHMKSVSYFAKKFKERFGVTPKEYQKANRNIIYHWIEDVEYGFNEAKWNFYE